MYKKSVLNKIICLLFAAVFVFSLTACSKNKQNKTVSIVKDVGKLNGDTYELPYEYDDGYKASFKTVDDAVFESYSTTNAGNLVIQLHSSKSEAEVQAFYDEYFATLPEVKAKAENDKSTGWYDENSRLVLFNLHIWTADGNTVYSIGANKCEDISKSELWELK